MPTPVFLYRSGIEAPPLTVTTPDFEALDRLGSTEDVQPVTGECNLILEELDDPEEDYAEVAQVLDEPPTSHARRFVLFTPAGRGHDLWFGCDAAGDVAEAEGHDPNPLLPPGAEPKESSFL